MNMCVGWVLNYANTSGWKYGLETLFSDLTHYALQVVNPSGHARIGSYAVLLPVGK